MDVTGFLKMVPAEAYWLFVFFSTFVENVFPPYPGDTVVVFGGYLSGAGMMGLAELFVAVYMGNILSASLMYYAGEKVLDFFRRYINFQWAQDFLARDNLMKAHDWFKKYGFYAVLFSRFSAGIRFFVAIVAGMVRMPFWLFLIAFILATTIWNGILVYGGYLLGDNWDLVLEYLRIYNITVGVIIALGIVGVVIFRYMKYRQQKKA